MNWDRLKILMEKAEEGKNGSSGRDSSDNGDNGDDDTDDSSEDADDDSDDSDDDESDDDEDEEDDDDDEKASSKDKKKKKGDEDDELSAEDAKQAKALFKLLKDPNTQKATLEVLAKQAGLIDKEGEPTKNKTETKKAAKKFQDGLKEALGEKLAFLADKLGPFLEKYINEIRSETNEGIQNLSKVQIENETEAALNKLSKETKGMSRKFESKMAELTSKLKPQDGVSTYDYLKNLYTIASSGSSAASVKGQIADRIRKNRSDAPSRLASSGGEKESLRVPKKTLTSREAAEYALKEVFKNSEED